MTGGRSDVEKIAEYLRAESSRHSIGTMSHCRVKFCGMMRVADAVAAAEAGADAIGLILHPPARRFVDEERARQIVAALPAFVTAVGVFVDAPVEQIRAASARLGLSTVQLHGEETPEQVAALTPLRVIKSITVERRAFAGKLGDWRRAIAGLELSHLRGIVLETVAVGTPGGRGVENDWEAIAEAQRGGLFEGLPPIILAGGLRPENVGQVVGRLRPWAVDTSSGIEQSPGMKSAEKMARFIHAIRAVAPQ